MVLRQQQKLKGIEVPFSPKEVTDYREQLRQVRDVVEYHTMSFTLLGDERATRVQVGVVSNNFFSVLGIKPVLGRTFTPDDETTTAEAVVILSHEYWMKQFAGERNVTQRFLTMNDKAHRIIGVLPPYVQFPGQNDLYMPTTACPFRSSERVIGSREARMVSLDRAPFERFYAGRRGDGNGERCFADASGLSAELSGGRGVRDVGGIGS